MDNNLIEKIKEYEVLRATKEDLADQTKANNEALKKVQEDIVEIMVEEDIPSQGYGDYNYTPQTVKHFSFKSEEKLMQMNADKIEVMRENGFDFLIKETINQRSMESAFKEILDNGDELPEEVAEIVTEYEEIRIQRRKAKTAGLSKAQKAMEG